MPLGERDHRRAICELVLTIIARGNHHELDHELIDGECAKGRLGRVRPHQQRLGGLLDSSGPPVERVQADEDSASRVGAAHDCATRSGLTGVLGETTRFRRSGSALSDRSCEPVQVRRLRRSRHTIVLSSAVDLGSRVHDGFAKLRAEPPRKPPSGELRLTLRERGFLAEFTVLIEGGSGPEPHPSFIDLFFSAAVRDGHRTVAGAGKDEDAVLAELARRVYVVGDAGQQLTIGGPTSLPTGTSRPALTATSSPPVF